MKPESPSPRKTGAGRTKSNVSIPHLPMEWMDPMSWRLPSGKALAEFALQTGFLAPLIMRAPKIAKKPGIKRVAANPGPTNSPLTREQAKEAPGAYGVVSVTAMSMQIWIAIGVGLAAVIDDLARRHIANWIPAAALAGGFGWQIGLHGAAGALTALAGTAVGFLVFLIFFLLGGMGGGDVKLMAGFGALLGSARLLEAALWTAGIGGIMAVTVLGWRALCRRLRQGAGESPRSAEEREREASIPYAPAIALGVWMSLVPKG